ncbi:MAG TPA: asparagine synthase-related protein [Polyangiaceae bacterium]
MQRDLLGCVARPTPMAGEHDLARLFGGTKHAITALDSSQSVFVGLPTNSAERRVSGIYRAAANVSVCLWGWDGLPLDPSLGFDWSSPTTNLAASLPGEYSRRFILIVWDDEKRELQIVRDPLGLETVYYARLGVDGVAISNRLQALLCLPELSNDPDPLSCAEALLALPRTPGGTMVRAIQELPRGTALTFAHQTLSLRRVSRIVPRWVDASPDVMVEAMRERLAMSVRKCLGSSQRSGVAFSGGVDSSAILANLVTLRGPAVTALTHIFPTHPEAEESCYQEQVLEQYPCQTARFTPLAPLALDELIEFTDEPEWIPVSSLVTSWARYAENIGLDCVITGNFGDHVGGPIRNPLEWLLLRQRWCDAWDAVQASSRYRRCARFAMAFARTHQRHLKTRAMQRQVGWRCTVHWLRRISRKLRNRYDLEERVRIFWLNQISSDIDFVAASESYFDGASCRVGAVRRLAERASTVRIEDPFVDVPLVEVTASLPFGLRWDRGMNRIALRNAMCDTRLPDGVRLRRTKAKLDGPHVDFFNHLELQDRGQGIAPLEDLLELSAPTGEPFRPTDADYAKFRDVTALSVASFLRMMLNGGATKINR